MKASDLIKAAQSGRRKIPAALLDELRVLVAHNDKSPPKQRVPYHEACKMIREGGVACAGINTLQAICREHLGRASWGQM